MGGRTSELTLKVQWTKKGKQERAGAEGSTWAPVPHATEGTALDLVSFSFKLGLPLSSKKTLRTA